jgi:hypothetical protein
MIDSDCQTRFSLNFTVTSYVFSINEANQLALGIRSYCYVLTLSESGTLVSVASKNFLALNNEISVFWHPHHSDMVIVGYCKSFDFRRGFISFFNITSNES